jgi:hypothetical protein
LRGRPARLLRSRVSDPLAAATGTPSLTIDQGEMVAHCGGGGTLAMRALEVDGVALSAATLAHVCGSVPIPLGD